MIQKFQDSFFVHQKVISKHIHVQVINCYMLSDSLMIKAFSFHQLLYLIDRIVIEL